MRSLLTGFLFIVGILCSQMIAAHGLIKTDSLDSILRTIKNPNEKVDVILRFLEKPENQYLEYASDFAQRAYIIAQQNNYALGKVRSMIKLGNYYFRSSDYKKAMEYAHKSKEMAEDLNFDKELAYSLNLIGTIFSELDDYDHSSQYLFKSLRLFEKINDKAGISNSLGNIGIDFNSQQEYKKALEYYNNSLILAKEINDQSSIKTQYNNIAVVYEYLEKYDTAILFFRKALEINIKLGNKLGQGINIMNIGYDQMNKGYFEDARLNFQRSLDIFTELNNRTHMAECYLNFGFCNQAANRMDESIEFFKKALFEGQKNGYYRIIAPAAQMLNQIYTGKKDLVNAYKYVMLEKLADDSLYTAKRQLLISKFELQYIYEKKEFERQQNQQTKNIIILIIIFGLIAGLVVLGLVFSRYRLKSKLVVLEKEKIVLEKENVELEKEKIKSELEIKDRELTVNLISLIKKNEILADISNKLAHLEYIANGKETKETIAKISQELRNSTDDKMFNEFSQRFQEVHAGFYEKLLQTYPDLSQNELKLCAFLRLNMSTKDIAELTGQQLASIDTARYRLRKKLALSSSETNLVTFLSQI
ncbi:MAG: tetratricopeptide repeat protein [Bacteroidales bacterium]|jgi:tetratricopeptide (TPR) repeat protein|nr:tetratricopeptide repeat protein [Bacteroidales bacterium]